VFVKTHARTAETHGRTPGTLARTASSNLGIGALGYVFEAAGLAWLAQVEDGCSTPRVFEVGVDRLLLEEIHTAPPSVRAARSFGTALARTHGAGADGFGALPPGVEQGFIAELPLPTGHWYSFGSFYAEARLLPFADLARDRGRLGPEDHLALHQLASRIMAGEERLCGPSEDPARLHGDLWSGNALWRARDVVLIDPSAHGGHRESDLAMLALFGLPYLDVVLDAYQEEWPLAPRWQERQGLHQLYPLLVHAVLFGGSYGSRAGSLARGLLAHAD
jgi:fructosamine-3-kinase